MTYLVTAESYGRPETRLNLRAFATDLAKAMGTRVEYDSLNERDPYCLSMAVGEGSLSVARMHGKNDRTRVEVSFSYPHKVPHAYWPNDPKYKFPTITVDTERPMAKLVQDIGKRIVEASQPAIAAWKAYCEQTRQNQNRLLAEVEKIRAAVPAARITVNDAKDRADFSFSADNAYLTGTLNSDGSLHIGHCSSITPDRIAAVLAALGGAR